MIHRSSEAILVSEEQLAEAIRLVEETCAAAGVTPDIEVGPYVDPEYEDEPPKTMITAHVRTPTDLEQLLDLLSGIGRALREHGLLEPVLPLTYHLSPEW